MAELTPLEIFGIIAACVALGVFFYYFLLHKYYRRPGGYRRISGGEPTTSVEMSPPLGGEPISSVETIPYTIEYYGKHMYYRTANGLYSPKSFEAVRNTLNNY
jgi:hypothetical protein